MAQKSPTRRDFLKTIGAGATAMALPGALPSSGAAGEERPNILFIISDQHWADVMSCAGRDIVKTPNMDRLAKGGVRFTKTYVSNPLCVPSRASFMTGKMPTQCRPNVEAHKGLGVYLKEVGYDTGYFGKWHIKGSSPTADNPWHGFDTIDSKGVDLTKTKNTVDFIKRDRDNPFFLVSSLMNPHDICQWARIHAGREDTMDNGDIGSTPDSAECPELPANHEPPAGEPEVVRQRLVHNERMRTSTHPTGDWDGDDWRQYRWAYCRLIELVDKHIGEMLEALEESGQLENTLIIYTSDHGDGFGAHKWNQKMVLYEEAARVPYIVNWPGKTREGVVDDRLVNMNLDLIPTVCDFAGVEAPKELMGKSIRHMVMADSPLSKEAHHPFVVSETKLFDDVQGRLITTGRYKYIVYSRGKNPDQFFDLDKDPGEMNSLVGDPAHRSELERHRNLLKDWTAKIDDTFTLDHVT